METLVVALAFMAFLLAQIAAVIAVYGDRTGRRPETFDAARLDRFTRRIRNFES